MYVCIHLYSWTNTEHLSNIEHCRIVIIFILLLPSHSFSSSLEICKGNGLEGGSRRRAVLMVTVVIQYCLAGT